MSKTVGRKSHAGFRTRAAAEEPSHLVAAQALYVPYVGAGQPELASGSYRRPGLSPALPRNRI